MRNFRMVVLVCILYGSIIPVRGQTPERLSLAECVKLAIENNATLQQAELQVYRDQVYYKQANYNRLPSVGGNIQHGYNEGRSVNTTSNQFVNTGYFFGGQSLYFNVPIFNGFEIFHDIRRKASAKEAGKLEFEGATNELKLDVIEAYISVLTAGDMLKQTKGQLAVTQENVNRMEVMQREGAADPGDFHDLKGQLSADQNLVEVSRKALYASRLHLSALLSIPIGELSALEPLQLSADQISYSYGNLYDRAVEVLPQFKAMDWRIKEAEQSVKVAKSDYYPSLSLDASIQSRFSSIDEQGFNYWQQFRNYPSKGISLNLNIPIFNKMSTRSQVKLAKLSLEEAKWNKKILENALQEKTAEVVFNLQSLRESIHNLREQEQSYQEAFRIAQVHFDAGNSNSWLLLTAKNKLDNAKNQLLIKEYEWILQKYINAYYAGTLGL